MNPSMESPSENPKKRVLSGSSSLYMGPDLVEIPRRSSSKFLKQNEKGLADRLVAPTSTAFHTSNLNSFSSKEAPVPWWPNSTLSKKPKFEPMSLWSYPEASQSKKKPSAGSSSSSQAQNGGLNVFPGVDAFLSWQNPYNSKAAFGGQPSTWGVYPTSSATNGASSSANPSFDPQFNTLDFLPKPSSTHSGFYGPSNNSHAFPKGKVFTPSVEGQKRKDSGKNLVSRVMDENRHDEVLEKHFKQFDMVDDYSDHHFASSFVNQPPMRWAKKIQEEWKILEKDLPDTIFVRGYDSRMDLLRAVIIGAEGTPYHDGLFFFDIFFPSWYPNVPPHVHFHSRGLHLNPNLYDCGTVCLSLLNTWEGDSSEMWIPGKSTILQVLVSIQALILNADPFFNEPGMEILRGTPQCKHSSERYNEEVLTLSLTMMLYTMRNPLKHFEEFVKAHFYKHAHGILQSCKAYMEGAKVGSLIKGAGQNVEASSKANSKSCTYNFMQIVPGFVSNFKAQIMPGFVSNFKGTVAGLVDQLVPAFIKTGAKDCDKFLNPKVAEGSNHASIIPDQASPNVGHSADTMLNGAYYWRNNHSSTMPNATYYGGYR